MLLVDDGEAEPIEVDALLDQRVRADGDLGAAVADRVEGRAALLRARRAGEQHDLERVVEEGQRDDAVQRRLGLARQQLADRAEVLLRQHLGRRHQHSLVPGRDGGEHHRKRDDRLARADVALQQAAHRLRAPEVREHIVEGAPLGRGERERQRIEERLGGGATLEDRRVPVLLALALAPHDAELDGQQLVEGETLAGLREPRVVVRVVDLTGRLDDAGEASALAQLGGERLGQAVGEAFEEVGDRLAQRALGEPLREVVHGHEAARVAEIVRDALVRRVIERRTPAVGAHGAGNGDLGAGRELLREVRLVEPHEADARAARVADGRLGRLHAAAPAHTNGASAVDSAPDRLLVADAQLRDGHGLREVVVAVRVVPQRVGDGDDAELLQPCEVGPGELRPRLRHRQFEGLGAGRDGDRRGAPGGPRCAPRRRRLRACRGAPALRR